MILHIRRGRCRSVVCCPSGVFLNFQKGCITGAVCSLLPGETVLGGTPVLRVVHLLRGSVHRVHPDTAPVPRY